MTTRVETSIRVNVPVSVAYHHWTQFEDGVEHAESSQGDSGKAGVSG